MFNFNDMYEGENNGENINELSLEVKRSNNIEHSPNKMEIGNNEISAIHIGNNSTFPDTSMNTTQFSLINKLQAQEQKQKMKINDNFDQ